MNNIITIIFDYNHTIDLSTKYIQFSPSDSVNGQYLQYFYNSSVANMQLSAPYNNLQTVYYNQESLHSVQQMKTAFLVLVILYWTFILVALMFKKGAIAMESMIVLQLTYLTLLDEKQVMES